MPQASSIRVPCSSVLRWDEPLPHDDTDVRPYTHDAQCTLGAELCVPLRLRNRRRRTRAARPSYGSSILRPMPSTRAVIFCTFLLAGTAAAQPPAVGMVDTPRVTVLRGLTVPDFEAEMQLMNTALGVGCGVCHVRGNFASEGNPRKAAARRMLEMTKAVNQQFFADYQPSAGASRLGKVTCFTCHQGNERPKTQETGPA